MSAIGLNIKKYRELKGLTQKQVADTISKIKNHKVSKNIVSNWENGLNKPDADTIEILLGIFGVDANTLLGWDDPQQISDDAGELMNRLLSDPKIKEFLPLLEKLSKDDMNLAKRFIKRLTGKDE